MLSERNQSQKPHFCMILFKYVQNRQIYIYIYTYAESRLNIVWGWDRWANRRMIAKVYSVPFEMMKIFLNGSKLLGRGNLPLLPLWVLVAGLIIKFIQDGLTGEKETNFNPVHGGLIEKEPEKWPKQAAFILFRQRNNTVVRNWQDNGTSVLGIHPVKNLNIVWA